MDKIYSLLIEEHYHSALILLQAAKRAFSEEDIFQDINQWVLHVYFLEYIFPILKSKSIVVVVDLLHNSDFWLLLMCSDQRLQGSE